MHRPTLDHSNYLALIHDITSGVHPATGAPLPTTLAGLHPREQLVAYGLSYATHVAAGGPESEAPTAPVAIDPAEVERVKGVVRAHMSRGQGISPRATTLPGPALQIGDGDAPPAIRAKL